MTDNELFENFDTLHILMDAIEEDNFVFIKVDHHGHMPFPIAEIERRGYIITTEVDKDLVLAKKGSKTTRPY